MDVLYSPAIGSFIREDLQKEMVQKPVNILFHGLFGMAENLRIVEKMLSHKYCNISYDVPNHGRSPSMKNSNFIDIAHLVHKTLSVHVYPYIEDKKVHMCGHSLGGKIAGVYALLYPEYVNSLILIDIAPVEYPPSYKTEIEALVEVEKHITENPHASRTEIKEIMRKCGVKDEITIGFLCKNVYTDENNDLQLRINIDNIAYDYDILRSFPSKALAGRVYTGKTLCIRGEKSNYVQEEYFDEFLRFFPQWNLETVKGAGHIIHAEKPKELQDILHVY